MSSSLPNPYDGFVHAAASQGGEDSQDPRAAAASQEEAADLQASLPATDEEGRKLAAEEAGFGAAGAGRAGQLHPDPPRGRAGVVCVYP